MLSSKTRFYIFCHVSTSDISLLTVVDGNSEIYLPCLDVPKLCVLFSNLERILFLYSKSLSIIESYLIR